MIESFETLLTECYQDFAPIHQRLRTASDFEAKELIDADEVLHKGTLDYFRNR